MTKRSALKSVNQAIKTADDMAVKNCNCPICKMARLLRRQLKPALTCLRAKP